MILGFDPQKANENKDYAYKCWYNRNYEGNTLRISKVEIQEIEKQWAGQLNNWKLQAESIDQNGYEISDFDDSENFKAGQEKAKETSGHDDKQGDDIALASASGVGVFGIGLGGTAIAGSLNSASEGLSFAGGVCYKIGCSLAFAIGLMGILTKPNQKPHDSLMKLQELMISGGQNMTAAQVSMEGTEAEIITEIEEGSENKEKSEEEIAELQELIQLATAMYEEIVTRIENGEDVSPSERAKLPQINNNIKALNTKLETLIADAAASSENNEANIEAKQEEFGTAAETVEKEIGITEYAKTFDEQTRQMAITQAVFHSANAVSGLMNGTIAVLNSIGRWWNLTFAALGFAGAGMSTKVAVVQSEMAINIKKEIDTRANTESIGADTWNVHEAKVSNSDMFLADVGEITEYFSDYEVPEYELSAIPTETPEATEGKDKTTEPKAQTQAQTTTTQQTNVNKKPLNPDNTTA